MSDLHRGAWTWDAVWLGCGRSKRSTRCAAGEMYTGPVFAAHAAIVDHLGFVEPEIMSAKHGLIPWAREIDPYEATLELAEDRRNFSAAMLREVVALVELIQRYRGRVAVHNFFTWAPGSVSRCGDACGPVQQPAILVLAGGPYLDGWIEQARAMGVRVDDPLRGYSLGDRRIVARRFCAETPRFERLNVDTTWGSAPEQLQGWLDAFDLERAGCMDIEPAPTNAGQLGLWEMEAQA